MRPIDAKLNLDRFHYQVEASKESVGQTKDSHGWAINNAGGRDHWGQCGSVVMAGGGVKGGNVIGASDKHAALPTQTPVGPPDIVASIYHALGLNPHALIVDPRLNRTLQLCEGDVIKALF